MREGSAITHLLQSRGSLALRQAVNNWPLSSTAGEGGRRASGGRVRVFQPIDTHPSPAMWERALRLNLSRQTKRARFEPRPSVDPGVRRDDLGRLLPT